jgi:ribonuclease P protein subunit POP4
MITPYNVLRHELCGLNARILDTCDKGRVIDGVIEAETRNTIKVKTKKGVKKTPKNRSVIQLELPEGAVIEVEGRLLVGRPEDRLKSKIRIRY